MPRLYVQYATPRRTLPLRTPTRNHITCIVQSSMNERRLLAQLCRRTVWSCAIVFSEYRLIVPNLSSSKSRAKMREASPVAPTRGFILTRRDRNSFDPHESSSSVAIQYSSQSCYSIHFYMADETTVELLITHSVGTPVPYTSLDLYRMKCPFPHIPWWFPEYHTILDLYVATVCTMTSTDEIKIQSSNFRYHE
jgi:hypothetical protein